MVERRVMSVFPDVGLEGVLHIDATSRAGRVRVQFQGQGGRHTIRVVMGCPAIAERAARWNEPDLLGGNDAARRTASD
jgi:hypothetical protein